MTIKVGDTLPNTSLKCIGEDGLKNIKIIDYLANKKVVLFSLPGAFTPTCSAKHLPGFVEYENDIKSKGIDEIICVSVNDAFVMQAWEKEQNSEGKVTLLADGNGEFAHAIDLVFDGTAFGLGKRGKRFAMIVDNGKVIYLGVENPGNFELSSAENILKVLG